MGKVIAREFIWLLVALIAALPLGIGFLWFLGFTPETINLKQADRNYIFWLYIMGYLTSFVCIYIMRFTALAIKSLSQPEEVPAEE